ncbi:MULTISPECIES: hypothetical protein [unclassified Janthinobacterium]|uniref:hypothetical protein n=1 Tax=unclassified Janthinobacterium TaxID=2610881 RepID=UPI00034B5F2A|nr:MULTISPECIES: hypothetical protein [unclassified Janthinobacterium]MEC5163670.1 hypothetical protein [Janthinobacterium sp. CG_S6]
MSDIIAGHFQLQQQIDEARAALVRDGFAEARISAFYVNQPGQHDVYEYGGDRDISPGAKDTPQGVGKGVVAGGAIGAAIGAATALVTGPAGPVVGALVGAHVGSLYSLHNMKEAGEAERGGENRLEPRRPGMLIAVACADAAEQERALALLGGLGAEHIERAQGDIVDGDWVDFDPLSLPVPAR